MLSHMDALKPYGQYWFVTITPYGKEIEPNVLEKTNVIADFKTLSNMVGVDSVAWRYYPIFTTKKYSLDFHLDTFEKTANEFSSYTRTCVISFIDIYKKVTRNFPQASEVNKTERIQIGSAFAKIGNDYGITIKTCAESDELKQYDVDCDGCLTQRVDETAKQG